MQTHFGNGAFALDGQRQYVSAAEIQYFRTPREQWQTVIDLARRAHCNAVSSYFPWSWHEPAPGEVDFTGATHPNRDVLTFTRMVRQAGMGLIVKPGPYVYGELRDGGLPDWVRRSRPEILARGPDGEPVAAYPKTPPVTYLHPRYLEIVRDWFQRFYDKVAGQLDNIVLWQVDNETCYDYMRTDQGGLALDYNPWLLETGVYADFLQEKLGHVDALNDRYRSHWKTFGDVPPPREATDDEGNLLQRLDWIEFKGWMIAHFHRRLATMLCDMGVAGPFASNKPLDGCFSYLPAFQRILDSDRYVHGLAHVDHFGQITPDNLGTFLAHATAFDTWAASPIRGDLEGQASAISALWGKPGRSLNWYFHLLAARGLNFHTLYWFNDGENFEDVGAFGRQHVWQSPVDQTARPAEGYHTLGGIQAFLADHPEIVDLPAVSDVQVGLTSGQDFAQSTGDPRFAGYGATRDTTLNVLARAGISFDFVDVSSGRFDPARPLVVAGLTMLAAETQQSLLDYVSDGGRLVLLGQVPELDENLRPCTILAGALGIESKATAAHSVDPRQSWRGTHVELAFEDLERPLELCPMQPCTSYAGSFEPVGVTPAGEAVAFRRPIGKGQAWVLGLDLAGAQVSERRVLCRMLGLAEKSGPILRLIRTDGRSRLETLVNVSDAVAWAEVDARQVRIDPYNARFVYRRDDVVDVEDAAENHRKDS